MAETNTKNGKTSKILVIGSSNTDMVVRAKQLPRPGETVLGGKFVMVPGGKGANQAVSVARLGGNLTFVCKVGDDVFGKQTLALLEKEGIDTSYIFTDMEEASGVALITVDEKAENCIAVASGANANLTEDDIKSIEQVIDNADYILLQLEVPLETVEFVVRTAAGKGKKVVLNPAPAQSLSPELLADLYLVTPNETEAEMLSGVRITDERSACEAAKRLLGKGVEHVIITLGSSGALYAGADRMKLFPAYKVKALDTTAAGDVFNGALLVAMSEGCGWDESIRFAAKAAAISVTRLGAQSSVPNRSEVESFVQ